MYFMFCVSLTALAFMIHKNYSERTRNIPLLVFSLLLLAVAVVLVAKAWGSPKLSAGLHYHEAERLRE